MSGPVFEVPARSRKWLRAYAQQLRTRCALTDPRFPVIEFFEFFLPTLMPGFEFEIGTREQMGNNHGETWPDEKRIRIRDDVYERAHEGHGRDRLTVVHEVGHLVLHGGLPFARAVEKDEIPAYRSSEWQANCFAGELLFPADQVQDYPTASAAAEAFGISEEAANIQLKAYKKDGLI